MPTSNYFSGKRKRKKALRADVVNIWLNLLAQNFLLISSLLLPRFLQLKKLAKLIPVSTVMMKSCMAVKCFLCKKVHSPFSFLFQQDRLTASKNSLVIQVTWGRQKKTSIHLTMEKKLLRGVCSDLVTPFRTFGKFH